TPHRPPTSTPFPYTTLFRSHPAILPIHFIGEGEGLVYYVMPFVEGESLADALRRRGSYAPDDALRIAEPILEALAHAHAQGLVRSEEHTSELQSPCNLVCRL